MTRQTIALLLLLLLETSSGNLVRRHRELQLNDFDEAGEVEDFEFGADGTEVVLTEDIEGIRGGFAIGSVPWFVRLEGLGKVCGGSLIHGDIVLTSGACLSGGFPSTVLVGPTLTSNGTAFSVSTGVIHPSWANAPMPPGGNVNSDINIGVLKLTSSSTNMKVTLNSNASVPSTNGQNLQVMGFGQTDNTQDADRLRGAFVPHLLTCGTFADYNSTQTICADARIASICTGDSGGPAVLGSDLITQIGVISWGDAPTCTGRTIMGFARVSHSYNWIQEQICNLSSNPPATCPTPSPTPAPTPCAFSSALEEGISVLRGWIGG